jgi:predicted phosphodiesterase
MNKLSSTVSIAFVLTLISIITNANAIGARAVLEENPSASPKKDLRVAAAGDWGCKPATQRTASLINSKNPDLVLGLGDYSYDNDTGCWLKMVSPFITKMKIVIGEHDFDTQNYSRLQTYVNRFNMSSPYYSFNKGNVHFLALSSIIPFNNESLQFKLLRDETAQREFVSNDLYYASQNKSINWIIVYMYRPMYTSPSQHGPQEMLRDIYQPLFDYYGVDLVLQAHNHNYQRSYPLRFNHTNSSDPVITDRNTSVYIDPRGTIFTVVGTGGAHQYELTGKSPYIVNQFQRFGFLNIDVTDNGTKLVGTFFDDRDGHNRDQFTIVKRNSNRP